MEAEVIDCGGYDKDPSHECDDPYQGEIGDEDEDDYLRDEIGRIVKDSKKKIKRSDVNLEFRKK